MWREFRLLWLIIAVMLGGLLASFAVPPKPAYPHDAPSGMKYDAICCNGTAMTGDCAPIPDSAVRITADGYEVTLRPGDHQLVTKEHVFYKLYSEVRYSTDGGYHACLFPTEDRLLCLYVPPVGSQQAIESNTKMAYK